MYYIYLAGPDKLNFKLPGEFLSRYLKANMTKLEYFLLGGGGYGSYAKGEGGIATGNCDLKDISLCDIIKLDPKPIMYYELISAVIDHGVLVNGHPTPLALAVNLDDHELAVVLLKKNAKPEGLLESKFKQRDDTPVHTAFRIGLSSGKHPMAALVVYL